MNRKKSHRIWWLAVVFFLLLNVVVWQRERLGRWVGKTAIRQASLDNPSTERYIQWAEWIYQDAPEAAFAKARLARRSNDFDLFAKQLAISKYLGMDEERLKREQWYAWAQSGQMRLVKDKLASLTDEPNGEEAEICEAFAVGFIRLRDFQSALSLLNAWMLDFSKDARPHAWIGQIYAELKDNENAELSFRKALSLDRNNASAALGLGNLLLDVKRPDEAKPYFLQATQDKKLGVSATVGYANSLMASGNTDKAYSALKEAVAAHPKDHQLLTTMSTLLVERGDYQGAEELLKPIVEAGSLRRELRYAYALALRGLGRTEEAKTHFDYASRSAEEIAKANQLIPDVADKSDDPELRYKIGVTHLQYGNIEDGLMWLGSVLELNPKHGPTHAALAEHYQRSVNDDPRAIIKARQHSMAAVNSRQLGS
ncbi:MAG: tetratricopeptide repeat protein [Pirellula sp.]|jgi:Tfp pilus assembly protein PilF|nr:tetratricopeptide repeat protein [Pirellula sp.]